MKKTKAKVESPRDTDELRPEYRFDYSKAKPNRFAMRKPARSRMVLLEPDVAEVFKTPEAVNAILRALIRNMPNGKPTA